MEEELILQQPTDRRLGNAAQLPPGPPGVELDSSELEDKVASPAPPKVVEKEAPLSSSTTSKLSTSSRRRSPSNSPPPRKRRSPSRGRRSPSPLRSRRSPSPVNRRRRSPSPRRNRYRDYSPDRRRFNRRRSPSPRDRRRNMRRSPSPPPRRGGSRWSPKKKPNSPAPAMNVQGPPPPITQTQYGVMPPQMYGGDAYAAANAAYNQYGVAQSGFAPPPDAYGMQAAVGAPPAFNAAYPPPPSWDAYAQQSWMSQAVAADPGQMQQMQAPPPSVVGAGQLPLAVGGVGSVLSDAAPGTIEPNPVHDAAVAQEAENQRDELKRQRASYLKKTSVLKKELRMLRDQRKDLNGGGAPPSPTTKGFIDENDKLQSQIQKKLSTIENVIDMLTGIIGDEKPDDQQLGPLDDDMTLEKDNSAKHRETGKSAFGGVSASGAQSSTESARPTKKNRLTSSTSEDSTSGDSSTESTSSTSATSSGSDRGGGKGGMKAPAPPTIRRQDVVANEDDDDSSPERLKNKIMESMKAKQKQLGGKKEPPLASKAKEEKSVEEKPRFNYVFYDPEMHWCQSCDVFPKTAKDFLNHLHSKEHLQRERIDTPWHLDMVTDQYPNFDNASTKRTPIRGLTFFVPATAWFCKLCSVWMGDLHCASTHLKSQLHSKKYNAFLEKNPHFEVNWLADRQRTLNEKTATPLPPQITSISTTGGGEGSAHSNGKNSKREDEKMPKKRRKKSSDKKDKKKKKKRSKKRKRTSSTSSTSSGSSSTSSGSDEPKKRAKKPLAVELPPVQELNNPNPAASIRVTMRKQQLETMSSDGAAELPPPPPPSMKLADVIESTTSSISGVKNRAKRVSKWSAADANDGIKATATTAAAVDEDRKRDDSIIQQWNTVQPVISDSEKKLLEQLKGKLKSKPREVAQMTVRNAISVALDKEKDKGEKERERERDKEKGKEKEKDMRDKRAPSSSNNGRQRDVAADTDRDKRRRSRSPFGRGGGRSRSRSRSRGRGGGGDFRRGRRSRSRSRGRFGGRRGRRSRSRSLRRRSRSLERRRRQLSRSRSRSRTHSRTRSISRGRVEKPVIRHSEFRPRVPEKDKEKKTSNESKDRKDSQRKSKSSASSSTSMTLGKKLPFIGKMPVFKKQTAGQSDAAGAVTGEKRPGDDGVLSTAEAGVAIGAPLMFAVGQAAPPPPPRPPAPTAAQIQMAMMEDVYGNAPPFHPDAGMMMDYDDLMPDPVQFVNLMGQAPPPPPPTGEQGTAAEEGDGDDADMLPPGIDGLECEDYDAKSFNEGPPPPPKEGEAGLPKDLEEALNLIFPGEKEPGEQDAEQQAEAARKALAAAGQTQIIVDEPVMQPEDLMREGIHMVTIEETVSIHMDEASQLSMNEPLVFNKPHTPQVPMPAVVSAAVIAPVFSEVEPPMAPSPAVGVAQYGDEKTQPDELPEPDEIPMPAECAVDTAPAPAPAASDADTAAVLYDLDDIPPPPDLPNDRDKGRRQEEWDDLAMLGIDADDMAAQCI